MEIKIFPQYGHWVVHVDGKFFCTADTYTEAVREIEFERLNKTVQN